jgi:uncharacterized protein YndB with AHSA1/START domain
VKVDARPQTVFPFFTDPEKIVRWIGVGATLDPRPGGVFYLHTTTDYSFGGEYILVEPYSRVAFTWGYTNFPGRHNPLAPGSSIVEVELLPDGDGTIVRLSHSVPTEVVDFHSMWWENYLGRLVVAVAGRPGAGTFPRRGRSSDLRRPSGRRSGLLGVPGEAGES